MKSESGKTSHNLIKECIGLVSCWGVISREKMYWCCIGEYFLAKKCFGVTLGVISGKKNVMVSHCRLIFDKKLYWCHIVDQNMARKILFCDCGVTHNPYRHTVWNSHGSTDREWTCSSSTGEISWITIFKGEDRDLFLYITLFGWCFGLIKSPYKK